MNRTVAFLDILGFRALVESVPADELGQKFSNIVAGALPALNQKFGNVKGQPKLFPDIPEGADWCIARAFSDSIILVAKEDSESGCMAMLTYALLATQILIALRLPIRGGIVHGELYVSDNESVFVGKALTGAYDLEQRQNWIGVAIDSSVPEAFPRLFNGDDHYAVLRKSMFPLYEVPMKGGANEMLHTLNWHWNLHLEKGTRSLFDDPGDRSGRAKIEAALAYARYIREARLGYPAGDVAIPVELFAFWFGVSQAAPQPPHHGNEQ